MKFLGTLAVGFSSVAAMLAALLSFGFHVKVESPLNPGQAAQQQLAQCTVSLNQAEQQVAAAESKAAGLEVRLRETALAAEQAASRLSAEVAQRTQLANENAALANSPTSLVAGAGIGLLAFPLGFLFGRRRNNGQGLMASLLDVVRGRSGMVVEPPTRDPAAALPAAPPLPLFDARRVQSRTGAVR